MATSWSAPAEPVPAPKPGLAAQAALALIRAYKLAVSPWLTGSCRFVPTCADYTAEAIARHGLLRGTWLGAGRLSRCHPLGSHGHDPVPLLRTSRVVKAAARPAAKPVVEDIGLPPLADSGNGREET